MEGRLFVANWFTTPDDARREEGIEAIQEELAVIRAEIKQIHRLLDDRGR